MDWGAFLAGAAAGVLSAFGLGGGSLLLVYMTAWGGLTQTAAQGINLLYFLPTAGSALPSHIRGGYVDKAAALPAILTGLVGTALGAWAATSLDPALLKKGFGLFLLFIGLRELLSRPPTGDG